MSALTVIGLVAGAVVAGVAVTALVLLLRARARQRLQALAMHTASIHLLVLDIRGRVVQASADGAAVLSTLQHAFGSQQLTALPPGHVTELRVEGAPLRITVNPLIAADGVRRGTLIESMDRSADLAREEEQREHAVAAREAALQAARLRQALESATACMMITDERDVILFLNAAAQQLMQSCEAQMRTCVPAFSAAKLPGTGFDVFAPASGAQSLPSLERAFATQFTAGGRTLRVIANPIVDGAGKRLGSVVEWLDRTQELGVEDEVQAVICDVLLGDLDRRIELAGKQGYTRILASGINTLVENIADTVTEVQALVAAVNDGDLAQRIQTRGRSGLTGKLGAGINELTANVAAVLAHLQDVVRAANEGMLDRPLHAKGRSGLTLKLSAGVNQLTQGMAAIVSQVKVTAGEVSRGAEEITTSNVSLSRGMEAQASSLEQTAASMEQMTGTVRQNADNAAQANTLAIAARGQAELGGAVVARAVHAMSEINRASRRIADIIGVINEIAFQTNLLALNAAVEAARAGEQGRGFAVVATEVRNLAGRSATAAKEIKALITDSVQKVEDGSKLVAQSGTTLEQIVTSVKRVTDIVADIAAASHEQSVGIEQVNRVVVQLDDLTQQNAALVEQASAASHGLAGQARRLDTLMQHYHVAPDMTAAAREAGRVAGAPPAERRRGARPWASDAQGRPDVTARRAAPATGTDDAAWSES